MFVPVISHSHHGGTVINKTIVYSDTVLSLKEHGQDIRVTSVKASKYSFEECVRTILEANPDVIFNTIQYSYQQEKVIFYTNLPISTEKWEKRFEEEKNYLAASFSLASHIKELLNSDRILNPDCIALYDVLCLSKKINVDEKSFEEQMEDRINCKLKAIDSDYYICLHGMDYKNCEYRISLGEFCLHSSDWYEEFSFKRNGNDLYISKRDGRHLLGDKILLVIGKELSELFEYEMKMASIKNNKSSWAQAVNSIFSAHLGYYGVNIYNKKYFISDFEIEMYSYSNEIYYKCNSANLMGLLKGNEYNLYKKIFVKIDDCPFWMHDELRQIRREQLVEEEKERKLEEQRRIKEEYKQLKKQKRREVLKKIFPFVK